MILSTAHCEPGMTLDLDDVTAGWDCPPGEMRARTLAGRDGQELLQLRVDLGVLQMFLDGRPDGERYHGLPTARAHIGHELRLGAQQLAAGDWQELERELLQTNYRRMALAAVADAALQAADEQAARRYIQCALRDIDECLAGLQLLTSHGSVPTEYTSSLGPALHFDRARLTVQLNVIDGQLEEAIEQAVAGAAELDQVLANLGYDEEQRAADAGAHYLQETAQQLRQEYGIVHTLQERLEQAVADEDFETAAALRDELTRRKQCGARRAPPAGGDQGTGQR
jgi:hypothetical protein